MIGKLVSRRRSCVNGKHYKTSVFFVFNCASFLHKSYCCPSPACPAAPVHSRNMFALTSHAGLYHSDNHVATYTETIRLFDMLLEFFGMVAPFVVLNSLNHILSLDLVLVPGSICIEPTALSYTKHETNRTVASFGFTFGSDRAGAVPYVACIVYIHLSLRPCHVQNIQNCNITSLHILPRPRDQRGLVRGMYVYTYI